MQKYENRNMDYRQHNRERRRIGRTHIEVLGIIESKKKEKGIRRIYQEFWVSQSGAKEVEKEKAAIRL